MSQKIWEAFHWRGCMAHDVEFDIISSKGNANENHKETSPHAKEMADQNNY